MTPLYWIGIVVQAGTTLSTNIPSKMHFSLASATLQTRGSSWAWELFQLLPRDAPSCSCNPTGQRLGTTHGCTDTHTHTHTHTHTWRGKPKSKDPVQDM